MLVNTLKSSQLGVIEEMQLVLSLADQEQLSLRTAKEYMKLAKHRIEMEQQDE